MMWPKVSDFLLLLLLLLLLLTCCCGPKNALLPHRDLGDKFVTVSYGLAWYSSQ
jgi:hypothetical protein